MHHVSTVVLLLAVAAAVFLTRGMGAKKLGEKPRRNLQGRLNEALRRLWNGPEQ